ncbi:amidohydrolase family protein [Pseudoruegeria sp. SHC-113]|uniref:amidohydrolase family protein n=1 Tax=Pseudoruegeria sp. SHC-113 TaxID=2855439 RepID=UPI0021BB25F0|nr:amidohydrolase family protein [Pseudoruegeria sp. SHC-113]MCT8158661.1 amidohydrolase family protein [Pseudoruegeria sp. SHC-113]
MSDAALEGVEIIDAHHHFWDLSRFPYRWLAPGSGPGRFGEKTLLQRDYLVSAYQDDFAGHNLTGSVHVQANCGADDPVAETAWLQELSDATGGPSAAVAEVDLCAPEAAEQIARNLAFPVFRGLRTPVAYDAAGRWRVADRAGVLAEPAFRAALPLIEAHGLCLEMVVVPAQLPEVAALAAAYPGLTIVINHFATLEPDQPGNAKDWFAGIDALSDTPNVVLKLSGLWTADRAWSAPVLKPYVDFALAALGAERMMYGSNLPVETVNCPLKQQMAQLKTILSGQPDSTIQALFSGTARRVYRLAK